MTECTQESFPFAAHFSRQVIAEFSADRLTSDGGVLLLRQVDRRLDLLRRFAQCFADKRNPLLLEHTVGEMVASGEKSGLRTIDRARTSGGFDMSAYKYSCRLTF